ALNEKPANAAHALWKNASGANAKPKKHASIRSRKTAARRMERQGSSTRKAATTGGVWLRAVGSCRCRVEPARSPSDRLGCSSVQVIDHAMPREANPS